MTDLCLWPRPQSNAVESKFDLANAIDCGGEWMSDLIYVLLGEETKQNQWGRFFLVSKLKFQLLNQKVLINLLSITRMI